MNSKERHEARYLRRKLKRNEKNRNKMMIYDDFDKVFTWDNLYSSYHRCCLGVGWKCSTQLYKANAVYNITNSYNQLHNGTYKSKGFYEFDLIERGKKRHIKSVHISERIVQKCLCDYSLTPILTRTFIYDNGACMKGKGIDFAISRLKEHLRSFYRKHGNDGYVLVFDFSKYFDRINHKILKEAIAKKYTDQRILRLINMFIDNFGGEDGLGLGSQISQVCALFYPNRLDHAIKEKMGIKYYGRYMDDGYLIHHDKEHLRECMELIKEICGELGIVLNENKTQIIKLSRYFTFLKKRVKLTETGKVVMKISKKSIKAMRRKLHHFKPMVDAGQFEKTDIITAFVSWLGHVFRYDTWHTALRMKGLFKRLYGGYA